MATPCDGLYAAFHIPIPPNPPARIAEGAQTIRINSFLAARVTSKVVCGASIKQGAVTVYFGGPTQRLLAVFDLESMLLSALGFIATASLIAIGLLTIPLGIGAVVTFGAVLGGFWAVNYGLGALGDRIGPGWRDIFQGGFGLASIVGGAKAGAKALEEAPRSVEPGAEELRSIETGRQSFSEPVDGVTGEVCVTKVDFVLPGTLPLELKRNYASGLEYSGCFCPRWASTWGQCVEARAGDVDRKS